MADSIGLIGVGTMGRVILASLLDKGYTVYAVDPVPAARQVIRESGAVLKQTPAAVAEEAGTIVLSLPAPVHCRRVAEGEGGLLEALGPRHLVIDTSTIDPDTTKALAEKAAEKGAGYLDAPILGRPSTIGEWLLPVGGTVEDFTRGEPFLLQFAKSVVHAGASGSGNTFKLLNQLMFSAINGITAEVFSLAKTAGISPDLFYTSVAGSGAATVSGLFIECGRKIVDEDYSPVFPIKLLCKDAGLGIEMAKSFGAVPVIASSVQVMNEIAEKTGLSSLDTSALVRVFDRLYTHEETREASHENR